MDITVIICTWNRALLLDRTLESMRVLDGAGDLSWEILVINNNSTDHTDNVVDKHKGYVPVRSILERVQGLCAARNRGFQEAKGEILVWCDDDVIVSPGWISAYRRAARCWPGAGYFFGAVFPWYETAPRPHVGVVLNDLANGAWLGFNRTGSERELEPAEFGRGANMAIRRSAAEGLSFDAAWGRNKGQVLFGDDVAYCKEIRGRGYDGVWVPDAALQHFVPAERLSRRYLSSFYRGLGATMVRQGQVAQGTLFAGVPRWVLRSYVAALWAKYWLLARNDRVESFRAETMQWRFRGIIEECLGRFQKT